MKQFILNILIFIFPILIVLYPLDIALSKSLSKSTKYPGNYTAWNDIYAGTVKSDILVFGSSRATHHIDPKIMEDALGLKTYNFGVNGHGFWIQHLKYLEYLKNNPHPKHIFIVADWFTLEKRPDLYQYNQFLPYMLWNTNIKNYTQSYQGFTYLDYYIPLLRYYGNTTAKDHAFNYALKDKEKIIPYKTKGYRAGPTDKSKSETSENISLNNTYYSAKIDSLTVNLLNNFLEHCSKNHIQVTFVYTPEYIEEQKFIKNRQEAINIYKELSSTYHILYLDYSSSPISKNRKYFNSTMHLNQEGAELFTKTLAHDFILENK
ncbi:hypothetical protein [Xanthomarina sp. GH4-25]|uniref:hypothetical protein n=1 Tax=Xanthomarina sp. GH4-25 TaxID=3349335 RepID=UPI0038779A03